MDNFSAFLGV